MSCAKDSANFDQLDQVKTSYITKADQLINAKGLGRTHLPAYNGKYV
jgi:hypothetical protein